MPNITLTTPTSMQLSFDVAALPAVLAALGTPTPDAPETSAKTAATPEPATPSPERVRQVAPRIEAMIAAHGPNGVHRDELRKEIRAAFNGGRYADGSRRRDVAEAAVEHLVKDGPVIRYGEKLAVVKNPGPGRPSHSRWWPFR